MSHTIEKLRDFLPHFFDTTTLESKWVDANGFNLTNSFYEDSIRMLISLKNKQETFPFKDLMELAESLDNSDIANPSLFIFHVSRCGSTLVSQMLAQIESHQVFSEPPFLDQIFGAQASDRDKKKALESVFHILGYYAKANQRSIWVKLDSWAIVYYNILRDVFPEVPFLFLIREPSEVVRSHRKIRGAQMVPGLLKSNPLQIRDVPVYDLDLYTEKVLISILNNMMERVNDPRTYVLDYRFLNSRLSSCLSSMGLKFLSNELSLMKERSRFHSKSSEFAFDESNEFQEQYAVRTSELNVIYKRLNAHCFGEQG